MDLIDTLKRMPVRQWYREQFRGGNIDMERESTPQQHRSFGLVLATAGVPVSIVAEQLVAFGMIVSTALIIWKILILVSGSECPIVVVLRMCQLCESMEPGIHRGDLLFLYQSSGPFNVGEIVVYNTKQDASIPIVHRLLNIHEKEVGDEQFLTKGDNNRGNDRTLYRRGLDYVEREHVLGRAYAFVPYVGMLTIYMNDYPILKYLLIAVLGLFVIVNRE